MGAPKQFDWLSVQRYYAIHPSFAACQQEFGFSRSAWAKAVKRGDLEVWNKAAPFSDRRRLHDWQTIQEFYNEGNSYEACRKKFGFSSLAWTKAVRRGELCTRPRLKPLDVILATSTCRLTIKRRLLAAGILTNACEECDLREWRGKPIAIQIDHRNGIRNDHRLENLRMLCPNCHSQTVTFGGRNRSRFV